MSQTGAFRWQVAAAQVALLSVCLVSWGCGSAAGVVAVSSMPRDAGGGERNADAGGASEAAADAEAGGLSAQAPQILFSRGCFSGDHGLYIIRADGTDERTVYPAGASLKPELVYGQDHLLLAVDHSLYTVSLTTFDAKLLVSNYSLGFSKPISGNRWVYGSGAGAGIHMHVLALDTLADVDLGPGANCGTMPNGDLVYLSDSSSSAWTLTRYRIIDGSTAALGPATPPCGVLADERVYFAKAAVQSITQDLFLTDPTGANPQLLSHGWDGSSLLSLPDGRLLVSSYQSAAATDSNFVAIDPSTGVAHAILGSPHNQARRGGVSATGRLVLVLYGSSAAAPPDLWSVGYDGTAPVELFAGNGAANGNAGVDVAARSPASNVVFYRARADGYLDLFAVPDRGGTATLLGTAENLSGNVALLPQERVAFSRNGALFTLGLDGSGGHTAVSSPGTKQIRSVLPDGRIVFETVHSASSDLSIATADGSAVVQFGHVTDCNVFEMLAP